MRSEPAASPRPEDWQVLSALGLYRLALVILLLVMYQSGFSANFFQQFAQASFQRACYGYAIVALLLLALVVYRLPRLSVQAHIHFVADTAMVTWLVHATGGVPQGLGVLLLTPAVGCSLILSRRMAVLQAAIGTLAMFGEETLRQMQALHYDSGDYTQTGVLGLIFFATGATANAMAQRARRSEAIAERVGSEFANLSRLNESIIEAMQTGVLVVDHQLQVRTVNAGARRLLGRPIAVGRSLAEELPRLAQALQLWLTNDPAALHPLSENPHGLELLPRFTRLGWGPQAPLLV
ncbi:MAG TPA: PAS domain-containing protein, partial [Solimonas sp.]|nr:PAS domain-containing protein [Solimonas sp.]